MGASWQALAFGFAGLRPAGDVLDIAPRLPTAWRSLAVPVTFRGARLRVRIRPDHERVEVEADRALRIRIHGAGPVVVSPGRTSLALPERSPR
jgi:alpha,alpha-trehalose phosphorylase